MTLSCFYVLISRVRAFEGLNKPQTCGECGSTSHLRGACPVAAEKKAKKQKEEEEKRKAAA